MVFDCPIYRNNYMRTYISERKKHDKEYKKRVNLQSNKAVKKERIKLRTNLIEILGGFKCQKCDYNKNEKALQIHHINGDGASEREKFGNNHQIFRYYNNYPILAKKRLQVLCANCHLIITLTKHKN